jgi:hemerythrin-like metal-binding protein
MAIVEWNKKLSVGIKLIDEQHKSLIKRLNDVSSAIETGLGEREITKTLEFLAEYADFHFSTEEKHMMENNFPGLEAQKAKHQEFMDTLANLEQDFEEEGSTNALSDAINNFLFNWLTNHIQGLDQLFGDFLSEKGIMITEEG